jgi:hypothetical protein
LQRLGTAAQNLGPQFHDAFSALAGPVDSLTTGVIGLVSNAMPGLVAAVRAATPVFQGLASFLSQVGQGLGDFFSIIAQHGAASGTVFAALGQAVGALLPILAQLIGAGAELGATILPPIASVLGLVAKALDLVAPVLPVVLAGFLAFKAVGAISPMLDAFAQKLAFASYSGGAMGSMAGKASTAVSGLSTALPVLGAAVTVVGGLMSMASQQINTWGQALLDGGNAAAAATAQIQRQQDFLTKGASGFGAQVFGITNMATALGVGRNAMSNAADAAKKLYDAMSPLQQKQQDVTTATNNLQLAQQKYGVGSSQAATAAGKVVAAQAAQKSAQQALTDATNAALDPEARHRAALQGIATAARTAKTDTNLLKTALDALSGKTVDTVTAQIQLQDAIANATTATKGLTGSVVDAHGQLNVYTAAGRAAGTALVQIRDNGNQLIATMEQQGATSGQVADADAKLRTSFIQTAQKMGFTAGQASNLADQILGIPTSRNTEITADTAQAMSSINAVKTAVAGIQGKTITITTRTVNTDGSQTVHRGVGMSAGAIGGIVHAYANGGIEPMSGGIAQIMPPNRLRVIGDRVTDDEAFIPINRDLRSVAIWREAGQRMGQLSAVSSSGGGGGGAGSLVGLRVVGTLDLGGGLEGRIDGRIAGALDSLRQAGAY